MRKLAKTAGRRLVAGAMLGIVVGLVPLAAQESGADYISGAPAAPSKQWMIAAGGRLYDNWMDALAKQAPDKTHPLWPASNTDKAGKDTWRCKSCHGWDYIGAKGQYGTGSYKTGIGGVEGGAGKKPEDIAKMFTGGPHAFGDDLIPARERLWLAVFLAEGQHETGKYIARDGKVAGDVSRGKAVFQTVCAACHGYDGKTLSWGDAKNPAFVGTEANANPWEVLHKIRNGHPGHNMVAMQSFPIEVSVDVLTYAQTLPTK